MPCSHEEVDSRMCLHVKDDLENGARKKFVQTVDTDIVVILTDIFLSCKCIPSQTSFFELVLGQASTSDIIISMKYIK